MIYIQQNVSLLSVRFDEFGQMCIPTPPQAAYRTFPQQKAPFCTQLPHSLTLLISNLQLVLSVLELHINDIVQNMLFSCLFLSTRP